MTETEARLKISMHAGETEDFSRGYRYALKYGFSDFANLQKMFDEIFLCLKELERVSFLVTFDRKLLYELNEMLHGSILYVNSQAAYYKKVGVFAEVFSETICYLLNGSEGYFEAFANYKENYDDILSAIEH